MSPELFSTINSLLQFALIGLTLLVYVVAILTFGNNRPRSLREAPSASPIEHPWAVLARQNRLKFEPTARFLGISYKSPQVTGLYRAYNLHLKLVEWRNIQKTTLTLSANPNLIAALPIIERSAREPLTLGELLKLMTLHGAPTAWRGEISIDLPGHKVVYERQGEEQEVAYLQAVLKLASDLLESYLQLVSLGGIAVPALAELATQDHPLRRIASQYLYYISQETQQRLKQQAQDLLCSTCLVQPAKIPIQLSWRQLSYYGCRRCGQSQHFLEVNNRAVVVVLDKGSEARMIEQGHQIRVNWFAYTQPFDFNEVEIIQADDEAVERFAIQLGNDTDPVRRPRYRQMRCRVAPGCSLSTNTVRILRSLFGEVERGLT